MPLDESNVSSQVLVALLPLHQLGHIGAPEKVIITKNLFRVLLIFAWRVILSAPANRQADAPKNLNNRIVNVLNDCSYGRASDNTTMGTVELPLALKFRTIKRGSIRRIANQRRVSL